MRVRVEVSTTADAIPWPDVHGPARAVAYGLINSQDRRLATQLAAPGSMLVPLGVGPPRFEGAPHQPGVYATAALGVLGFGSPMPRIAAALLAGLADHNVIQWGSVALEITGVHLEDTPDHRAGQAVLESRTPVLVRHESRYILPDHPHYADLLRANLVRRAEFLGLPAEVDLKVITFGRDRCWDVQGKPRIGCTIRALVRAAPTLLDALWAGGLGLSTNQGFGWIGRSSARV